MPPSPRRRSTATSSGRPCRRLTLALDGATTNAILIAAGFDPEPSDWALTLVGSPARVVPSFGKEAPILSANPELHLAGMRRQIADHPWPCLLIDAGCDIAGGNAAAARLLGAEIRFNVVVARWNSGMPGRVWALDWHPAGAETWTWLGRP